jgi:hypothetical protein
MLSAVIALRTNLRFAPVADSDDTDVRVRFREISHIA